jgi:hypothetical protein
VPVLEQVETYDLPPQIAKATDDRAADFIARYGKLLQVELDALRSCPGSRGN